MKRLSLALLALCTIGLVGPAPAVAAPADSGASLSPTGPVVFPEHGALFGAFVKVDFHNGMDRRTAVTNFESLIGRPLAIERIYYQWDEMWPTADDYWSRDMGRTLYLSWNAADADRNCANWSEIADGLHDADIDVRAANLIAFGSPIIFSFHHEPTTFNQTELCGTPEEYKAAWRHIRERFEADGVTNVTYAFTLTALNYQRNVAEDWYPGDDVIDVVSADGYNWFSCEYHQGPWREIDEIFQPFHDFGILHNKVQIVAEYGSGEDDAVPGKKGQWFTNGADTFKRWPEIKAVSYFNVGNGGACDRWVDTSPSSLAAFQTMGAEPYFNPPPAMAAVSVADFAYAPRQVTISQGTGVNWSFDGPSSHTTTSGSLGLFDSGSVAPGGSYKFFFIGAGTYSYNCTIHSGMTGRVKVPLLATPPTGNLTTEFTVTWSAEMAPSGWAFDVQVRRPGSSSWSDWLPMQSARLSTFVPDGGAGRYGFRARFHNTMSGQTSGYSGVATIQVSP